jgi:protein FrlC
MSVNSGYGMKDRSRDDAWKRSCDLLRCVSEFALKYGVCLTLESLRPLETNLVSTIDETKRMIDEIHHSNLKAMVDTTAISVSGETLWDWFRNFKKDIKNLHFVDGSPNGHLAWGDGILELDDMICCLSEYGYEGPLGLEITDQRYMNDPSSAMEKSYNNLVRYVDD